MKPVPAPMPEADPFDFWAQLQTAADAGDEKAAAFLITYQAWVKELRRTAGHKAGVNPPQIPPDHSRKSPPQISEDPSD